MMILVINIMMNLVILGILNLFFHDTLAVSVCWLVGTITIYLENVLAHLLKSDSNAN